MEDTTLADPGADYYGGGFGSYGGPPGSNANDQRHVCIVCDEAVEKQPYYHSERYKPRTIPRGGLAESRNKADMTFQDLRARNQTRRERS
jgi:hypothetical protein